MAQGILQQLYAVEAGPCPVMGLSQEHTQWLEHIYHSVPSTAWRRNFSTVGHTAVEETNRQSLRVWIKVCLFTIKWGGKT